MKKRLHITIPKPCHESWDNMTPAEKGRFCGSCQKQVIDFTGMNNEQLIAFFRKPSSGSVCGRFINDQLDRDILIPRKRIPWIKYFFQFTIPVFLTSMKASSQGKIQLKDNVVKTTTCQSPLQLLGNVSMRSSLEVETRLSIKGRVIDENGEGIPFASLVIKGTTYGIACDSAGYFIFHSLEDKSEITLLASCVGFMPHEKRIDLSKDTLENIILQPSPILSGEVVVTTGFIQGRLGGVVGGVSVIRSNESVFEKAKDWLGLKKDSVTIYPNPILRSQPLNVEFTSSVDQRLRFLIYSFDGKLIEEKYYESVRGINRFQVIPGLLNASGTYIVQAFTGFGKKILTKKVVVQ